MDRDRLNRLLQWGDAVILIVGATLDIRKY